MKPMWTTPGTYRATITDEEGFVVSEWDFTVSAGDPAPSTCGCIDGMGRMDRNCHSYGLCRSHSRHGRGVIVECRRCKGQGWTGPNDPRPGVTCDDCNGTGCLA